MDRHSSSFLNHSPEGLQLPMRQSNIGIVYSPAGLQAKYINYHRPSRSRIGGAIEGASALKRRLQQQGTQVSQNEVDRPVSPGSMEPNIDPTIQSIHLVKRPTSKEGLVRTEVVNTPRNYQKMIESTILSFTAETPLEDPEPSIHSFIKRKLPFEKNSPRLEHGQWKSTKKRGYVPRVATLQSAEKKPAKLPEQPAMTPDIQKLNSMNKRLEKEHQIQWVQLKMSRFSSNCSSDASPPRSLQKNHVIKGRPGIPYQQQQTQLVSQLASVRERRSKVISSLQASKHQLIDSLLGGSVLTPKVEGSINDKILAQDFSENQSNGSSSAPRRASLDRGGSVTQEEEGQSMKLLNTYKKFRSPQAQKFSHKFRNINKHRKDYKGSVLKAGTPVGGSTIPNSPKHDSLQRTTPLSRTQKMVQRQREAVARFQNQALASKLTTISKFQSSRVSPNLLNSPGKKGIDLPPFQQEPLPRYEMSMVIGQPVSFSQRRQAPPSKHGKDIQSPGASLQKQREPSNLPQPSSSHDVEFFLEKSSSQADRRSNIDDLMKTLEAPPKLGESIKMEENQAANALFPKAFLNHNHVRSTKMKQMSIEKAIKNFKKKRAKQINSSLLSPLVHKKKLIGIHPKDQASLKYNYDTQFISEASEKQHLQTQNSDNSVCNIIVNCCNDGSQQIVDTSGQSFDKRTKTDPSPKNARPKQHSPKKRNDFRFELLSSDSASKNQNATNNFILSNSTEGTNPPMQIKSLSSNSFHFSLENSRDQSCKPMKSLGNSAKRKSRLASPEASTARIGQLSRETGSPANNIPKLYPQQLLRVSRTALQGKRNDLKEVKEVKEKPSEVTNHSNKEISIHSSSSLSNFKPDLPLGKSRFQLQLHTKTVSMTGKEQKLPSEHLSSPDGRTPSLINSVLRVNEPVSSCGSGPNTITEEVKRINQGFYPLKQKPLSIRFGPKIINKKFSYKKPPLRHNQATDKGTNTIWSGEFEDQQEQYLIKGEKIRMEQGMDKKLMKEIQSRYIDASDSTENKCHSKTNMQKSSLETLKKMESNILYLIEDIINETNTPGN